MAKKNTLYRYKDGRIPNTLAISFTLTAYIIGTWAITTDSLAANIVGMFFITQSLILSAYLIHEFAHGTIFLRARLNKRFSILMQWLNGSIYFPYDYLRKSHIQHHIRRADIVQFDFQHWLEQKPIATQKLITALEWAYIPAIEFVMRAEGIRRQWIHMDKDGHKRIIAIFLVRTAFFILLATYSLAAPVLYLISFMCFIQVLRFMDAHQHTYDAYFVKEYGVSPKTPFLSTEYEDQHTYSNLISSRLPALNLLVLNFPYHNAHHSDMNIPWYRLPEVHQQLYGTSDHVLPFGALVANFHKYRTQRIRDSSAPEFEPAEWQSKFHGVVGVSFLY